VTREAQVESETTQVALTTGKLLECGGHSQTQQITVNRYSSHRSKYMRDLRWRNGKSRGEIQQSVFITRTLRQNTFDAFNHVTVPGESAWMFCASSFCALFEQQREQSYRFFFQRMDCRGTLSLLKRHRAQCVITKQCFRTNHCLVKVRGLKCVRRQRLRRIRKRGTVVARRH